MIGCNNHIIGIGYCNAQHLLAYTKEFGYSAGSNGWACDYFEIDNICISTGYGYIHNVNAKYEYDTLREFENKAEAIRYDNNIKWEDKQEQVNQLLKEFVQECVK